MSVNLSCMSNGQKQCQATPDCKTKRAVRKLVNNVVVEYCLVCESEITTYDTKTSVSQAIDRKESVPEALKIHHNKQRSSEMDQALTVLNKAEQLQSLDPIELMKPEHQEDLSRMKSLFKTQNVSFKDQKPLEPADVIRLAIELKQITVVSGLLIKDLLLYGTKWYITVEGLIGLISKKVPNFVTLREVILSGPEVEALNYGTVAGVKFVKVQIMVKDYEIEEVHRPNGEKVIRRVPVQMVYSEAVGISGGPAEKNPLVKQGHGVRMAAQRAIRRVAALISAMPQLDVQLGVGAVEGNQFLNDSDQFPELPATAETPAETAEQPEAPAEQAEAKAEEPTTQAKEQPKTEEQPAEQAAPANESAAKAQEETAKARAKVTTEAKAEQPEAPKGGQSNLEDLPF